MNDQMRRWMTLCETTLPPDLLDEAARRMVQITWSTSGFMVNESITDLLVWGPQALAIAVPILGNLAVSYTRYRSGVDKETGISFPRYVVSAKVSKFKVHCLSQLLLDLRRIKAEEYDEFDFEYFLVRVADILISNYAPSWKLDPMTARGAVMDVMKDFLTRYGDELGQHNLGSLDVEKILHHIAKHIEPESSAEPEEPTGQPYDPPRQAREVRPPDPAERWGRR